MKIPFPKVNRDISLLTPFKKIRVLHSGYNANQIILDISILSEKNKEILINRENEEIVNESSWCYVCFEVSKMSEVKIRHKIDTKKAKTEEQLLQDIEKEAIDTHGLEDLLEEDVNIFLLNNLMMSVQFFENYERDVRQLRENWFKELSVDTHYKKCFYADSLFRLSAKNVKFSFRHGVNKNSEFPLRSFRIYVSSDNMEAAFDPSALGRCPLTVWPEYQFTISRDEKFEKAGCITLTEHKTINEPVQAKPQRLENPFRQTERGSIYIQHKSNLLTRKLTKTEVALALMSKNLPPRPGGKRYSVLFTSTTDDTIPVNGFYKFEDPKKRRKPQLIYDLRMNSMPTTSHEIPQMCYQYDQVENKTRRVWYFKYQRILNSAAFKGYFCDLLIEKLAIPLNLDPDAVSESTILEEFITVNDNRGEYCIAPVITVRDWNNFVALNTFQFEKRPDDLAWPSLYMKRIMKILPCDAVPTYSGPSAEDLDYEKAWTLVFPKTEEFLLLHMMHAHIRCYFFALLIYKSFIEPEINSASFGPKHLMHLLFWMVHRNFLAWPEDRPAETLLNYLKTLYKKIQNKRLPDFFITSRNLFATSFPKDLHTAQFLIKKILENPVPYMIRAISHLNLRHDFYPPFDYLSLNKILTELPLPEKIKKVVKKKERKQVNDDEVQLRKREMHKQIEKERKAEKEEEAAKLSVQSVDVKKLMNFDPEDWQKCNRILQIFASHFLQMGSKSMEYNFITQGLAYLYQTQHLLKLMTARGMTQENLKETQERINQLRQSCYGKIKQELRKSPVNHKQFLPSAQKQGQNLKQAETEQAINEDKTSNTEDNSEDDTVIERL